MTTNGKNSATPKNVADAVAEKQSLPVEEPIVPAQQAASPNVGTNTDRVVDHTNKTLFAGTSDEIVDWLNEHSPMIYAIQPVDHPDLITSIDYLKKHQAKPSLIQRAKTAAEKLTKNRKAMLFLGGAAIVAGLAVKNNRRKTVATEETLDDIEDTVENPDATDDSN